MNIVYAFISLTLIIIQIIQIECYRLFAEKNVLIISLRYFFSFKFLVERTSMSHSVY